jgi:hypothetical protein
MEYRGKVFNEESNAGKASEFAEAVWVIHWDHGSRDKQLAKINLGQEPQISQMGADREVSGRYRRSSAQSAVLNYLSQRRGVGRMGEPFLARPRLHIHISDRPAFCFSNGRHSCSNTFSF